MWFELFVTIVVVVFRLWCLSLVLNLLFVQLTEVTLQAFYYYYYYCNCYYYCQCH